MADDFFSGLARGLRFGGQIQANRAAREDRALRRQYLEQQQRQEAEDRARQARGRELTAGAFASPIDTQLPGSTLADLARAGVDPKGIVEFRNSQRDRTRKLSLEDEAKRKDKWGLQLGAIQSLEGQPQLQAALYGNLVREIGGSGIQIPQQFMQFNPQNLPALFRIWGDYDARLKRESERLANEKTAAEVAAIPADRRVEEEKNRLDIEGKSLTNQKTEAERDIKRLELELRQTTGGRDAKDIFEAERKLATDFQKVTKDFRDVRDATARVEASSVAASPAGDLALIFNYMKILDPGSVVRESEFAVAQSARPLLERLGISWDAVSSVWEGKKLTEGQRADFVERARTLSKERLSQYQKTVGEYQGLAQRYNLNPANVTLDFTAPEKETASELTEDDERAQTPALPGGIDPDVWKYMTPEERALWN